MNKEIENLKKELSSLEKELDKVKESHKEKEHLHELELLKHKRKWESKHARVYNEIKELQSIYETEKEKWQQQLQTLTDTLMSSKKNWKQEEKREKQFLQQVDAELMAVAARSQAKSREDTVNLDGDTLQDSMTHTSASQNSGMLGSINKARQLIKLLLERTSKPSISVPPLPRITPPNIDPENSKSLTDSCRDSSIYSKVVFNDEMLNSLTMSEREAVVYSLINAGNRTEQRVDVKLEDLLSITDAEEKAILSTAKIEDLSSIIEEDSVQELGGDPIQLTFSFPEIKDYQLRTPTSMNKPAKLNFSPISTPHSSKQGMSRSQSIDCSEFPTPLSETNEINKGQLQDSEEFRLTNRSHFFHHDS